MDRFEEIKIGDYAELSHTVSISDVDKFVELTGDDNKLHVDAQYASRTIFKKPVTHGMLGASFISTLIGTKLPGDGALWFSQSLDFLLPVRIGDEITVTARVLKKIDRERVLELQTDIFNGKKQKVTSGVARVKVVSLLPVILESDVRPTEGKKVAVIVGATGGIGAAAALKFAQNNYDLVLHYHSNVSKASLLSDELKKLGVAVKLVQGDIRTDKTIQKLHESASRLSPYVSTVINAATAEFVAIDWEDSDWDAIQKQIDIDVKSSFFLAKSFLPMMDVNQSASPSFIFLTSQSIDSPVSNLMHYIVSKSALSGMGKSMAIDFAKKGVRVNLISPGMTETDLLANVPIKTRLLVEAKCPRQRLAQPIDVANAIYFLASEDSEYLTGETIRVNGGQVMI